MPEIAEAELPKWAVAILKQISQGNYSKADQLCRKRINKGNKDETTMVLQFYSTCIKYVSSSKLPALAQAQDVLALGPLKETQSLNIVDEAIDTLIQSAQNPLRPVEKAYIRKIRSEIYEQSAKQPSTQADILFRWFFASLSAGDFVSCYKASNMLQKIFPESSRYHMWMILCSYLQGVFEDGSSRDRDIRLRLAHAFMAKVASATPSIAGLPGSAAPGRTLKSLGDLELLFEIYLGTGHAKEALELVDIAIFHKEHHQVGDVWSIVDTKIEILRRMEDWKTLFEFLHSLLEYNLPKNNASFVDTTKGIDSGMEKLSIDDNNRSHDDTSPPTLPIEPDGRGNTWKNWYLFVDAAFNAGETFVSKASKLLHKYYLLQTAEKPPQHISLAYLYLRGRQRAGEADDGVGKQSFLELFENFVAENIELPSCFNNVQFLLPYMSEPEVGPFLEFVETAVSNMRMENARQTAKYLVSLANQQRFFYRLLVSRQDATPNCIMENALTDPAGEQLDKSMLHGENKHLSSVSQWYWCPEKVTAKQAVNVNALILKFFQSQSLHGKFEIPSPLLVADALFLAGVSTLKQASVKNTIPILRAGAIFSLLFQEAPSEQQYAIALVRTNLLQGAVGPANAVWNRLRVKNLLLDTAGFHFFTRLSTLNPFSTDEEDPDSHPLFQVQGALEAYGTFKGKIFNQISKSLEESNMKDAFDKIEARRNLDTSISYWLLEFEGRRIERMTDLSFNLGGSGFEYPGTERLKDNRDEYSVPNFEHPDQPTTCAHLTLWPHPGAAWVGMFYNIEKLIGYTESVSVEYYPTYRAELNKIAGRLADGLNNIHQDHLNQFSDGELIYLAIMQKYSVIESQAAQIGWSHAEITERLQAFIMQLKGQMVRMKLSITYMEVEITNVDGLSLLSWQFFHSAFLFLDCMKLIHKLPARAKAFGVKDRNALGALESIADLVKTFYALIMQTTQKRLDVLNGKDYLMMLKDLVFGKLEDDTSREQSVAMEALRQSDAWWHNYLDTIRNSQREGLKRILSIPLR